MRFRTSGKLFNLRRLKASTKVLEELMQDLLYADDCALCAHSEADLQELCNHFAEAARLFGLKINLSKTEVMHQRPPRDESINQETSIKIGNVSLKEVPTFVYLGSTLSNDAMLDHEIEARIKKACSSFGRLYDRVWKNHGLTISTKVRVYEAVVLTILLYGSEAWILYRKHVKMLESFHIMRHLRIILGIRWQDKVTNIEVLNRANSSSLEALLIKAQLRWSGHVVRMDDTRLPKIALYGELSSGVRSVGGQRKRYKDTLKQSLRSCGISVDNWELIAVDRSSWRSTIAHGIAHFETRRRELAEERRAARKAKKSNPNTDSGDESWTCPACGRVCGSRIGLFSHLRAHNRKRND